MNKQGWVGARFNAQLQDLNTAPHTADDYVGGAGGVGGLARSRPMPECMKWF